MNLNNYITQNFVPSRVQGRDYIWRHKWARGIGKKIMMYMKDETILVGLRLHSAIPFFEKETQVFLIVLTRIELNLLTIVLFSNPTPPLYIYIISVVNNFLSVDIKILRWSKCVYIIINFVK